MAATGSAKLMSFVSEKDVEEMKKKRQEQWEKVRKPEDPKERPDEVCDARPLYERLKEQKDKVQEQYEEQFKFKNMIYKGLDDEEAGFLNFVVDQHASHFREMMNREREELTAYREAVAQLHEEEEDKTGLTESSSTKEVRTSQTPPISPVIKKIKSQSAILAGSIITKRKRSSSSGETDQTDISQEKKSKSSEEEFIKKPNQCELNTRTSNNENETNKSITTRKTGLTSLSMYSSSSEDEEEDLNRQKQQ